VKLAPDSVVPHREALLDEQAVARRLSLRRCVRVYAKYRVGESLRVAYRGDDGAYLAARTFRDGASGDAYRRARGRAVPTAAHEPVLHAPDLDAVFWTFPNDRRLTALPLVAGRSPALDRLLGRSCAGTRLVAYAPESSASVQCLDEVGRVLAYAKVQLGDATRRERRAVQVLTARLGRADRNLRVPHVIASSDDAGALALEPVEGRRLDALTGRELSSGLARLGAALAGLHSIGPVPAARFERLDAARLARAVGVIASARPDAGSRAAELLTRLLERREDAAGPPVCLHGDPNLRNALLADGRVALLDFEHLSAGPAAADLGHVLAGLLPAGRSTAGEALLKGYAAVAPLPSRSSLRWFTAASLLGRRALTAVNRLRTSDLQRLPGLLEGAFTA
jgi:Ser/Thr protein kinase RdoA (MazF antagonist)